MLHCGCMVQGLVVLSNRAAGLMQTCPVGAVEGFWLVSSSRQAPPQCLAGQGGMVLQADRMPRVYSGALHAAVAAEWVTLWVR
jgi:hypothetical protein